MMGWKRRANIGVMVEEEASLPSLRLRTKGPGNGRPIASDDERYTLRMYVLGKTAIARYLYIGYKSTFLIEKGQWQFLSK